MDKKELDNKQILGHADELRLKQKRDDDGDGDTDAPIPDPDNIQPRPSGGGHSEPPSPGGGGCFVKGMLVATPEGLIPIEQMQVLANIYSFDLTTNKLISQKVTDIIEDHWHEILVLNFGGEKIRCTPLHRFYTGQWVPAQKLQVGDSVLSHDGGWKILQDIKWEVQKQPVYNLTINGTHNYFVGYTGLLVHNKKGDISP